MRALVRVTKQRLCGRVWSMLIAVVVVWSNLVAVCNKSTSGGTTKEHAKHLRRNSPGFPCLCFPRAATTVSVPTHGRRNAQLRSSILKCSYLRRLNGCAHRKTTSSVNISSLDHLNREIPRIHAATAF